MLERGVLIGATRLIKRAWQIYVAHIILFVMYVAEIGYLSQRYTDPNLQNEFNVAGFMRNPSETLNQGLILAFKPVNMDVLPLYILLMVFFPPVLWAMLRRPNLTLAGSFLLYLVARHFDWNLHAYPTGWSFKTVLAEDLLHFVDLPLAQVIDFVVLALLFGGVVLCVRSRGEIAAETHRDGAGDHLGEPGGDDTSVLATAAERPAASANGTVRPSAIPITTSRTLSEEVKCFSMCGVAGTGTLLVGWNSWWSSKRAA